MGAKLNMLATIRERLQTAECTCGHSRVFHLLRGWGRWRHLVCSAPSCACDSFEYAP